MAKPIVARPRSRALTAALLGAVLAAACSPAAPSVSEPTHAIAPSPSGATPVKGGRIVLAQPVEPFSLQPVIRGPFHIMPLFYEPLAQLDRVSGEVTDGMGRISQSPDGRVFTIDIDPRATWSDGMPVVAIDWVTAVKGIARGNSKCLPQGVVRCSFPVWTSEFGAITRIVGWREYVSGDAAEIRGIRAEGRRLVVELLDVRCAATSLFAVIPPIPAHVFGKYVDSAAEVSIEAAPENMTVPVASGPFLLKEWRRGEHIVFGRNDLYWRGSALLDEYVVKVISPGKLAEQIAAGAVMGGVIGKGIDLAPFERLPSVTIHSPPVPGYDFISWNTQSDSAPALRDVRVRQALAYALDLDLFLRETAPGAVRAYAHTPTTSWAYTPGLNEYRYDPARADALLRSAGYSQGSDGLYAKDGRMLSFSIITNENNSLRRSLLQYASDQYARLGLQVTTRLLPFDELAKAVGRDDAEGVVLGFTNPPDPDSRGVWHSTSMPTPTSPTEATRANNFARFATPELDRALDEGGSPANGDCSIATRKRHYATVDRILNEDQPFTFAYTQTDSAAFPANLRGLEPGPFSPRFGESNVHRWWLAPETK